MQPLPIDPEVVVECRELAARIVEPVQRFIDSHTTVSVERTVLRALGVEGADAEGVPLVNTAVDRLAAASRLADGAAFAVGWLIANGHATTPQDAVEALAYGAGIEALPTGTGMGTGTGTGAGTGMGGRSRHEQLARDALATTTREALDRIDRARDHRAADLARLRPQAQPGTPLKYVIVATGNIYDDAEQARAAAQSGADIIAVIRSTAQSLLDYVPYGATTEGFGGTWATQENFRIVRAALDEEQDRLGRYLRQVNYSSGLCMPEIAWMASVERLDMVLNDAMYGILFRDINPRRTLCDQYFSRRVIARAGITINTGEDNYLTTADAVEAAHTVIASQMINEAFGHRAGLPDTLMGLGHAFEIDKGLEDGFLFEMAQAQLVRQLFPRHPIKWMPATKHKTGDIFWSHRVDGLFDLVGVATEQSIELLGMMTESIHTPLLQDRFAAIRGAEYVFGTARHLADELQWNPDGRVVARARQVLGEARDLLRLVAGEGLWSAIARGVFADVKRPETGGKGLGGVVERSARYTNPLLDALEAPRG